MNGLHPNTEPGYPGERYFQGQPHPLLAPYIQSFAVAEMPQAPEPTSIRGIIDFNDQRDVKFPMFGSDSNTTPQVEGGHTIIKVEATYSDDDMQASYTTDPVTIPEGTEEITFTAFQSAETNYQVINPETGTILLSHSTQEGHDPVVENVPTSEPSGVVVKRLIVNVTQTKQLGTNVAGGHSNVGFEFKRTGGTQTQGKVRHIH